MYKRLIGGTLVSGALALSLALPVAAANRAGDSLVNVQVSDVTILVPVAVAANLCDINVNVLAEQLGAGPTTCEATAESVATPGTGDGRGGNRAGDSLVNVQLDNILVALPISIGANVCDVNVNVAAAQAALGQTLCTVEPTATAG
jgi:hypothetical protein